MLLYEALTHTGGDMGNGVPLRYYFREITPHRNETGFVFLL